MAGSIDFYFQFSFLSIYYLFVEH